LHVIHKQLTAEMCKHITISTLSTSYLGHRYIAYNCY